MRVIKQSRAEGVKGRLSVKVSRDQIMSWVENFVDDFNDKETTGVKKLFSHVLQKLDRIVLLNDTKPFRTWINSLNKNYPYKSLLAAHMAVIL